jgi:hydroxymethylpyrimidine/phosphomethylpyrimidine kinase
MVPNLLSIAGSDPSGGAGIQADLKTFAALGCHGMAAVTALTAQNTRGVAGIHAPPADFLRAQLDAIFDDIDVAAIKIGMLGNAANVEVVAAILDARRPRFVVLDPVLAATSGDSLGGAEVVEAINRLLLSRVDLVTPNAPEAARLAGLQDANDTEDLRRVARALIDRGAKAVLVKGGHVVGDSATDVLLEGNIDTTFAAPWIKTKNTHGTGCTLSSAIAAYLAKGLPLVEAIRAAKDYLTEALRASDELRVGGGHGPVNHFWNLWPKRHSI